MTASRHLVRRGADAAFVKPDGWAAGATGYRRWSVVGEDDGAAHTGFGICELEPGGRLPMHVHSFEESFHVLDGTAIVQAAEGSVVLGPGDYGVIPVGVPHTWSSEDEVTVRWAEMQGPQPRRRFDEDTFVVPSLSASAPIVLDVRDPRTRSFGNITRDHMDATKQSQGVLAVSASMRTALLVYSGITVKMMVDSDLGAQLTTMFMVQYEPVGLIGPHDHPFEETYLILEGAVDAQLDGEHYRLNAGDVAWAGVGCVHSFTNPADVPVRWLETQAPQPPARHSYRFARDWDYLRGVLADGKTGGSGG
ncbi:MAG TPA: cupin domain-containing protein [Actinomycetes bacterium]|jgi:quercetin dioxygenase-like cupin family protein